MINICSLCHAEYAHQLMASLLRGFAANPARLRDSIRELRQEEPGSLASELDHPDKAQAIRDHVSRFNL